MFARELSFNHGIKLLFHFITRKLRIQEFLKWGVLIFQPWRNIRDRNLFFANAKFRIIGLDVRNELLNKPSAQYIELRTDRSEHFINTLEERVRCIFLEIPILLLKDTLVIVTHIAIVCWELGTKVIDLSALDALRSFDEIQIIRRKDYWRKDTAQIFDLLSFSVQRERAFSFMNGEIDIKLTHPIAEHCSNKGRIFSEANEMLCFRATKRIESSYELNSFDQIRLPDRIRSNKYRNIADISKLVIIVITKITIMNLLNLQSHERNITCSYS